MAAKTTSTTETISDINIVPLVDIILVVLIIFMVTAPALIKPSIEVDLPDAGSADATEPSLLNVLISPDGRVLVNNLEANDDEIKRIATEEFNRNKDVQAIIVGDQSIPYGRVIRVLDLVKSTGIKNFAVTTDKKID